MESSTTFATLVGISIGAMIWAISPHFVGYTQPWNAGGGYYPLVLLSAGIIAGIAMPNQPGALYVGAVLGQLAYLLFVLKSGVMADMSIALMLMYTLALLLGAIFGARIR